MTIPTRTKLMIDNAPYTVVAARSLRGDYRYILQNEHGKKLSIRRTDLLDAINNGIAQVK